VGSGRALPVVPGSSRIEEGPSTLTTDDTFPYNPERAPRWAALAKRARVARTWGDCYGYVLVDDQLNPWDVASLIPIISEAGGVYTDWRGGTAVDGGDGIATNRFLGEATRQALVRADSPMPG
jgi:3'-phosphoadenosine 5'-phosphosulfate (PAPS) 3'-phosphatase